MPSLTIKPLPKPKNERKTENLVRNALTSLAYYNEEGTIAVEEQKSNSDAVRKLLKAASKSGKGGIGAPEFIISDRATPDIIVIFECKADIKDHSSPKVDLLISGKDFNETDAEISKRNQRYAADGVLHYARHLAKEFNVIAVAVSGETKSSMLIS